MLVPGQHLELLVEKPAAGGRMIARHAGQVVFVLGAIPGERVTARIDRVERQLAFATVADVIEPSPDRREAPPDPLCGGCLYSHVRYPRQLALKADIVGEAFLRLGRLPLEGPVQVAGSPETGYRMRARFHVDGDRVGFFAERSHRVCDALGTGQVTEAAVTAVDRMARGLRQQGTPPVSLELTENIDASGRAIHVELGGSLQLDAAALAALTDSSGATGCVVRGADGREVVAGTPSVADPLTRLLDDDTLSGELRRRPQSFFQGNRFLLPRLVAMVVEAARDAASVLDLYAGVGLFSVSLAAVGRARITAVEGHGVASDDLARNAAQFPGAIRVWTGPVERYLATARPAPDAVIVDPPRSGISREAMLAVTRLGAPRVIYVSCDPATMARDARRLVDAGYTLRSLQALDLFPNTPHVEAVGMFER